jgi:hypothetical protein
MNLQYIHKLLLKKRDDITFQRACEVYKTNQYYDAITAGIFFTPWDNLPFRHSDAVTVF